MANIGPIPLFLGRGHSGKKVDYGSSGYPDASNTGVPVGTSLTPHSGNLATTSNNQVIDSMHIQGGSILVAHTGVTISKCLIDSGWTIYGIRANTENGAANTTITDCTIVGDYVVDSYTGIYGSVTARRNRLYGMENGFYIQGNSVVEDNFVHDLFSNVPSETNETHTDCIQTDEDINNLTIRHNTFLSHGLPGDGTTSAFIGDTDGHSNWTITDNVLAGGSYTFYGPIAPSPGPFTVSYNKFWLLYFTDGKTGNFGTWADMDLCTLVGNEMGAFSGGFDDTNKLIRGYWTGTALSYSPP